MFTNLKSPAQIIHGQLSLLEVVSQYLPLKRQGSRYVGLCPFHSEKTPSFGVHVSNEFYKCFGCGAGGDLFKFIEDIEGVTFPEALKLLANRYAIDLELHHRPHVLNREHDWARNLAIDSVDIRAKARKALLVRLLRLWLVRLRLDDHLTRVFGANLTRWQAVDSRLDDLMMRMQSGLTTVCNASATAILAAAKKVEADAA